MESYEVSTYKTCSHSAKTLSNESKKHSGRKIVKAKSKEKLKRRVTREMSTFGLGSIFGTDNSPTYSNGVYLSQFEFKYEI